MQPGRRFLASCPVGRRHVSSSFSDPVRQLEKAFGKMESGVFRKEVVRVRGEFEEDLKDGGRTWGALMKPGRLLSRHGESEISCISRVWRDLIYWPPKTPKSSYEAMSDYNSRLSVLTFSREPLLHSNLD